MSETADKQKEGGQRRHLTRAELVKDLCERDQAGCFQLLLYEIAAEYLMVNPHLANRLGIPLGKAV